MREFNPALVRMLQWRLGSWEDACDTAQEAWARLIQAGNKVSPVNFHRAYLFRIAQNLATDLLRRRALMEQPMPDMLDVADVHTNPERSANATQVAERLPSLLAELPRNCADAFRLVRVEQLSFTEAAARLNLTERMVRIHVARALTHCQERLDGIARPHKRIRK